MGLLKSYLSLMIQSGGLKHSLIFYRIDITTDKTCLCDSNFESFLDNLTLYNLTLNNLIII